MRDHIRFSLQRTRWFTNSILESFQGDDWLFQVHPASNHALWVIGHLGLADNLFASQFRPDTASKPDGWDEFFWYGSELKDAAAYPAVEDVRNYFDERRENLLAVVDDVTDEELAAPAPPEGTESPIVGAPNIGHLLLFTSIHENLHVGQLTVQRRALGNSPLFAP